MKTFKQYLKEVFDKHFPVEKIGVTKTDTGETHHYAFRDHKDRITNIFLDHDHVSDFGSTTLNVEFTDEEGSIGMTGHAGMSSSRHIGSIIKAVKDHIADHNKRNPKDPIEKVKFTGAKAQGGKRTGRTPLYTRLAARAGGTTRDYGTYTGHTIRIKRR